MRCRKSTFRTSLAPFEGFDAPSGIFRFLRDGRTVFPVQGNYLFDGCNSAVSTDSAGALAPFEAGRNCSEGNNPVTGHLSASHARSLCLPIGPALQAPVCSLEQ